MPIAGSAYTYGYATLGEFFAWVIGWDLILEYALGAATVAVGWSGHLVSFADDFLGVEHSRRVVLGPVHPGGGGRCNPEAIINLPAVLITLAVTVLIVIGIRESAQVNTVIVIVKVAVVLIVILGGAAFINAANWQPFIPENTGTFGEYGWSGIVPRRGRDLLRLHRFRRRVGGGAGSQEPAEGHADRHPRLARPLHDLLRPGVRRDGGPRAVRGDAGPGRADGRWPFAAAEEAAGGSGLLRAMTMLVEVGAISGLSSVMVVMMMAQPRIFYSMANDGLLPPFAKKIHPKYRTPHVTSIITGVVVAIAAGFTPIGALGELVSIGTLMAFVIVSVGIIFLRRQRPDLERPFRTPFVPVVPILSALVSFGLMAALPLDTWIRLLIWMAIGMVIYFGYGYRHSKLRAQIA